MPKRKTKTSEAAVDVSVLTLDQQADLLAQALGAFTDNLVTQGFSQEVVAAVWFEHWQTLMCDLGDRPAFEEMLEMALEDDWPEHWVH